MSTHVEWWVLTRVKTRDGRVIIVEKSSAGTRSRIVTTRGP